MRKKETPEEKRRRFMENARKAVASAYESEEHAIINAINTYNSIEKARNLMFERLEEWYSIYFPELRLANPVSYANFVINFGRDKNAADPEKMTEMLGEKVESLQEAIGKSIGKEPKPEEYESLRQLAESQIGLQKVSQNLESYIEQSCKRAMPNISYLIDTKIAAELLAKAGSLERLAMFPAGTIQLLGAEKALFKHLKYHSRPPKYGILFRLPQVSNAAKYDKGRIARVYATKISIAAKADAFSKNFIAKELKEQLEKSLAHARNHAERDESKQKQSFEKGGGFRREGFTPRHGHGNRGNRYGSRRH